MYVSYKQVTIKGTNVEQVSNLEYLGIIIDHIYISYFRVIRRRGTV